MSKKVVKISVLVISLVISIAFPILAVTAKKTEWVIGPVYIDETMPGMTWADWADEPWLKGLGTEEDPYMIKNVVINGEGSQFCMMISNSIVFFKIQDCTFSHADTAGLILLNTQNGIVFKNQFLANGLGAGTGIALISSHYNRIQKNLCDGNAVIGMYLQYSNFNLITQNLCQRNYWAGIYIGEWSSFNEVTKNDCIENMEGMFITNGASDNEITRNDCSNNNGNGIYLSNNANHNLITMNDCYNNEGTGIVVETSNSNIINKNDCKENLAEGIALKTSNEHIITENECSENGGAGIYLETSNDNLITSNNCRENLDSGVLVEASYGNLITDNQCSGNLRPNIYLRYSNDNLITQNLCTGSPWGIVLRWSNNNEVTMNDCIENGEGIVIQEDATDNRITNNTCTNNYENGIILILNANYNTVSQNIFSENLLSGIWVASSSGTIIMKNDCSNNGESGISVTDLFGIGARDNILYGNNIENNINGIYFSEADNNHIFRNTIMGNDNGMVVEGQSELNLIYQNNFICNDVQALNEHAGLNNWHNIYMLEGNYWSDYTGTDSDGDGIGETPWPFPDFDAYPFIEINGWDVKTPLEEELLDVFYNPDFNRLGDYRTVHGNKTTYILAGMGNGFSEMIRDSYLPPYTMRLWFYGTEVFMQGSIWHFEEESAYGEPIWFCLFYLIIPPYYLYAAGLTPGWHEFQWELTFYTGGEQQTAYLTSYFYLV